jgi:hypothetical protein
LKTVEETAIVAVDRGTQEADGDQGIELSQAPVLPPGHLGNLETVDMLVLIGDVQVTIDRRAFPVMMIHEIQLSLSQAG